MAMKVPVSENVREQLQYQEGRSGSDWVGTRVTSTISLNHLYIWPWPVLLYGTQSVVHINNNHNSSQNYLITLLAYLPIVPEMPELPVYCKIFHYWYPFFCKFPFLIKHLIMYTMYLVQEILPCNISHTNVC